MAKNKKQLDIRSFFQKDKLLISCIIVLLLIVAYQFGKSQNLFLGSNQAQKQTPTPTAETITNIPIPTAEIINKGYTQSQPTAIQQATEQRVSVYIVSLNQTANCRQQNEASARDLANEIDQNHQEQLKCFDDRRKSASECTLSRTNCIDLDAKWKECMAFGDKEKQMIDALNQMCK